MRVRLALFACAVLLATAPPSHAEDPIPLPEGPTVPIGPTGPTGPTVPLADPDQILLDGGGIKVGFVKLTVPRGCRRAPFQASVTGDGILRVDFRIDGRLVRSVRAPNSAGRFVVRLNPRRLRRGTHRLGVGVFFGHDNTPDKSVKRTFRTCSGR